MSDDDGNVTRTSSALLYLSLLGAQQVALRAHMRTLQY